MPDRLPQLAALVAVLLCWASPAAWAQVDPLGLRSKLPIAVEAEPLADGLVRHGEWAALRVRLANRGPSVRVGLGLDELDIDSGERRVYHREVELPKGSRKEVHLYYRPGMGSTDRDLAVQVGQLGLDVPFRISRLTDADVAVGIIGDHPLGIPIVADAWTGYVPGSHLRPSATERSVRSGLIPIDALPDRPAAYAPLDWVVWHRPDPTEVGAEELDALLAWVADGGHLLVTVTDNWRSVEGTALAQALPVELIGVEDGDPAGAVYALTGVRTHAEAVPLGVARLDQTPGRRVAALARSDQGLPQWAMGTWGLGTVHVLLVDPTTGSLAKADRETLWRNLLWLPAPTDSYQVLDRRADLLGLDHPWVLPALRLRPTIGSCVEHTGYWPGVYDWNSQLLEWLDDIPGVAPLPMSWLLLFSGLYLLTIGPLDYLLLKLLHRQPLTWITFPVTIAVFSAVALVGTSMVKGNQAVVNRLEVVDVLPGTDLWRGTSYLAVFATRKTTIQMESGFDDSLAGPLWFDPGFMSQTTVRTSEGSGELQWRASTWSLAHAQTTWVEPGQGTVTIEEYEKGWRLTSTLPFHLTRGAVVVGDTVHPFGALKAGGMVEVPRSALSESLPDWAEYQSPPLNLAIEHSEPDHGHLDLAGYGSPALIALADRPVEPVQVRGLNPDSRITTVIRIPLWQGESPLVPEALLVPPGTGYELDALPDPYPDTAQPVFDGGGTP